MPHSVIFCILVQILAIEILKLTNVLSVTVTIKSYPERDSGNDKEEGVTAEINKGTLGEIYLLLTFGFQTTTRRFFIYLYVLP